MITNKTLRSLYGYIQALELCHRYYVLIISPKTFVIKDNKIYGVPVFQYEVPEYDEAIVFTSVFTSKSASRAENLNRVKNTEVISYIKKLIKSKNKLGE